MNRSTLAPASAAIFLALLSACAPAPVGDALDAGAAAAREPLSEEEAAQEQAALSDPAAQLAWDNDDFEPEVNRSFSADGEKRSLPLGSVGAAKSYYAQWKGESSDDRLGISVAAAGDLNGDGLTDIVAGSLYGSGTATGDGAAYMERGPFTAGDSNIGGAKGRYYTPSASAKSLMIVGGGGDVDNDGNDDFILGANTVSTAKTRAGAAYLVMNYTRGKQTMPITTGGFTFSGEKANDLAGTAVDIIGDVNGDNYADVIVTATGDDVGGADAGAAYVILGPVTADVGLADANVKLAGQAASDQLGTRANGVGDTDGDGNDDFIVSSRNESSNGSGAGAVYLFTSVTDGVDASVSTAAAKLQGEVPGDNLGNQIDHAGDVNNDGYDDFIVGSINYDGVGAAYLIQGPVSGTSIVSSAAAITFIGNLNGDQFGSGMTAGDVDGDGNRDVIVSANREGVADNGAVYVFLNPASGTLYAYDADTRIVGTGAGDYLGSWLDFAEDTNRSGTDMIIVGASGRGQTTSEKDKGAVYLFDVP